MELEIQKYLRSGGSLERLETQYGITSKPHPLHTNLVLFKYNQIASPFDEQIVRECRGIILDSEDNWRAVSMAFSKFFNYGEGHAAEIDWSTARVQEKVDGSLCVLYYYGGQWHVATTGTPDGHGDVHGTECTFAKYFWDTLQTNYQLVHDSCPKDHCFFFELSGPANRIVVVHDRPKLTLLGARHIPTLQEIRPGDAQQWFPRVPIVQEFPLQSWDDITATFETMSPLAQEGYVVCDARFNRVKVKHPGYVALHHAKDGLSQKAMVEIARSGESSEVLTAFPEFKPMLDDAQMRVGQLCSELEDSYRRFDGIAEQKAFAQEALKTRCSAAFFQVRSGKTSSIRRFIAEMRIDHLMDLLGY